MSFPEVLQTLFTSRALALEWDSGEVRAILGVVRGGDFVVERTLALPLPAPDSKAETVGQVLHEALADLRLNVTTLVAIGRASIELRRLSLPPAPDAELPALVRFAAQREFNALGDDHPLDYMPLDDDPSASRNVLAAAISPELIAPIREACAVAGLVPRHLILRPAAAAALFVARQPADAGTVRLLVDPLAEEVDLTVLSGDRVVFMRTARVRDVQGAGDTSRALAGEIRRTLAAASNQWGGGAVAAIHLCGGDPTSRAFAARLSEELEREVLIFDPWEGITVTGDARPGERDGSGRFAPLLGILSTLSQGQPHSIDFLHPRQPRSHDSRRRLVPPLVVAGLLLLLFPLVAWWNYRRLDREAQRLEHEAQQWLSAADRGATVEVSHQQLEAWQSREVQWLDELLHISSQAPPAEEIMLTQLSFVSSDSNSQIQVDGLARDVAAIARWEAAIRGDTRRVAGESRQHDVTHPPYQWRFRSRIVLGDDQPIAASPGKNTRASVRRDNPPRGR